MLPPTQTTAPDWVLDVLLILVLVIAVVLALWLRHRRSWWKGKYVSREDAQRDRDLDAKNHPRHQFE